MYVVAAAAEQAGTPRVVDNRPRRLVLSAEPVGTQHAAPRGIGAAPPPLALCGAGLEGWVVFTDLPFDPGCAASCQRCAQLVAAATRPGPAAARTSGRPEQIIPPDVEPQVRARSVGQVAVLEAAGPLADVVDDLDRATRFALAGRPRGVVCDLSHVGQVSAPAALQGLALNGRHPRDWPGVPLAVAGLGPRAGESLRRQPLGGYLLVSESLQQALSAVMQTSLPAVETRQLPPHPTAPRASRDFVTRTLLDWRLSRHVPAACLVVSELVTNAMIHAGTDILLTLAEHRRAIRIAVRDEGAQLPVVGSPASGEHGRGLPIVAGLSRARGVLPHVQGGKEVWAVIDADSPAQGQRPR